MWKDGVEGGARGEEKEREKNTENPAGRFQPPFACTGDGETRALTTLND